jgi:hypothetical protein
MASSPRRRREDLTRAPVSEIVSSAVAAGNARRFPSTLTETVSSPSPAVDAAEGVAGRDEIDRVVAPVAISSKIAPSASRTARPGPKPFQPLVCDVDV